MSDRDPGPDDQIGKRETDAAKLKLDGEAILKKFSFGEKVKWDVGVIKCLLVVGRHSAFCGYLFL